MTGQFISERVDAAALRARISSAIICEASPSGEGLFYGGALTVCNFLSDEGRQFLEGQIFAYGSDFRAVYKTQDSVQCPDEITIMTPETQIPVIGAFAEEFDSFLGEIFPWTLTRNVYQLRIYEPRYGGHPEHVDYAPGFTISNRDSGKDGLTSASFSIPISWNGGLAPAFKLQGPEGEIFQTEPGSLAAFGPRVVHCHPSAPNLNFQYAWLISQAFFEFDVDE